MYAAISILNREYDSHARSSGKQGKVRLLLSRPRPKEAAVLAYSQKLAHSGIYDETQSSASNTSVGLIGSAFDGDVSEVALKAIFCLSLSPLSYVHPAK